MNLLERLIREKQSKLKGGLYHKVQVAFAYNSNHIEGSTLTEDQTRRIYETNTVGGGEDVNVDDVIEATNHFRCVDFVLENAKTPLSESMVKQMHKALKSGTRDSQKDWFCVGEYKKLPNEVGGSATTRPENVAREMASLMEKYSGLCDTRFYDILDFHVNFEKIHPFTDGNGRVGRLIMFKECLRFDIVPFIIDERHRWHYYRGLKEWGSEKGFLTDTCLSAQDTFKEWMKYFEIN